MIIFSGVFFSVFAWFREQACTFVCPYGRLQTVLLDKESIIVAYDYVRGEPREKFTKKRDDEAGDCIDCKKCVFVCPTGIDIRNGTQMECVNCTACMDACDAVMLQIDKPIGLIRYTSENNIREGKKFRYTGRMKFYSIILTILIGIIVFLLTNRSNVDTRILRAKGQTYTVTTDGYVSNLFTMKSINKTYEPIKFTIRTPKYNSQIEIIGGQDLLVEGNEVINVTFLLRIPQSELEPG
ncbi:MAG: 4Fe-4S dicluster domain-containing protein, partial [Candidatus Kapaibacterium sp.]